MQEPKQAPDARAKVWTTPRLVRVGTIADVAAGNSSNVQGTHT